jgi:hypothetical protein
MEPRSIVNDRVLQERVIDHYTKVKNIPDVSDKPTIPDENMGLWQKQKTKSRLKAHSLMRGVCGKWLNNSYDYAIANNKWPVRFKDRAGVTIDLVMEFTVTVWTKYVSQMVRIRDFLSIYTRFIYVYLRTYTHMHSAVILFLEVTRPNWCSNT